jgi:hypothetical protein
MDLTSQSALRAATGIAEAYGVRSDDPVVLSDGAMLVAHLRPAPVVARVPTGLAGVRRDIGAWLEREVAVSRHLERSGIPVQTPSAELPAGPHERDGFVVTFWTLLDADGSRDTTADECAALLPDLHAAMAGYPGDLPLLAPAASDVPLGMAGLVGLRHLLGDAEIADVRARAAELVAFVEDPDGTRTGLHGDVHPGNLMRTTRGPVWIALTDTCRGPAEWDVAQLAWLDRWSGTTAVRDHLDPDPDVLRTCSDLRAVHAIAALVLYQGEFGGTAAYAAHLRSMVDLLLRAPR